MENTNTPSNPVPTLQPEAAQSAPAPFQYKKASDRLITFFTDALVIMVISGAVMGFYFLIEMNGPSYFWRVELPMLIVPIAVYIIWALAAHKKGTFLGSVEGKSISKSRCYMTSLAVLSPLILTYVYAMTCSDKFCGIIFTISLMAFVPAFIVSLIYCMFSSYPKRSSIYLLVAYATVCLFLIH